MEKTTEAAFQKVLDDSQKAAGTGPAWQQWAIGGLLGLGSIWGLLQTLRDEKRREWAIQRSWRLSEKRAHYAGLLANRAIQSGSLPGDPKTFAKTILAIADAMAQEEARYFAKDIKANAGLRRRLQEIDALADEVEAP